MVIYPILYFISYLNQVYLNHFYFFQVQGIIEQRPVSSVLQSAAFRRRLENVIRGGLVSAGHSRRTTRATTSLSSASRRDLQQLQSRQAATAVPSRPTRRSPRPVLQEDTLPESFVPLSGKVKIAISVQRDLDFFPVNKAFQVHVTSVNLLPTLSFEGFINY